MTPFIRSAKPSGGRHPLGRAMVHGVAATVLAVGVLMGSATSAAADPGTGHLANPPFAGHHKNPDCWLCIM